MVATLNRVIPRTTLNRCFGAAVKPDDFGHFLETAETRELLAKNQHQRDLRLAETATLAAAIANGR
jgi:hypothetical protein